MQPAKYEPPSYGCQQNTRAERSLLQSRGCPCLVDQLADILQDAFSRRARAAWWGKPEDWDTCSPRCSPCWSNVAVKKARSSREWNYKSLTGGGATKITSAHVWFMSFTKNALLIIQYNLTFICLYFILFFSLCFNWSNYLSLRVFIKHLVEVGRLSQIWSATGFIL